MAITFGDVKTWKAGPLGDARDGEEQAEEWEENFDADYNQPVEADARKSGREYLDNLTADELDRLLEESK